jgi:hypothetical protein
MTLVPELFVRRLNKPKGLPINVRDVSVTGDGQTDDYAALNEAVRSAGATGTLYFPAGTYVVGTNLTIPACCIFAFGAKLKPSSSVTVTLSGPVETAPGESVIATGTAGTVSITGVIESFDGVLNVKAFGAVGDGVTDDTLAIQAALTASAGKTLLFPPGRYVNTGVSLIGSSISIVGYGATLLQSANAAQITLRGTWDTVAISAITATTYALDGSNSAACSRITVASLPSGLAVGDTVRIVADDAIPGCRPASGSNVARVGEYGTVGAIVGTDVYLTGLLLDTYTTNPRFSRSLSPSFSVQGLAFEADVAGDAAEWTAPQILVRAAHSPVLRDLRCVRGYGAFITLVGCRDYVVDNIRVDFLTNDVANNQFGYGVNDVSCTGGRVTNSSFNVCRHGFTTNVDAVAAGGAVEYFGRCIGGRIVDCVGIGSNSTTFDTHLGCYDYQFINCRAQQSSFHGFQARGQKVQFIGCVADRCAGYSYYVSDEAVVGAITTDVRLEHSFAHAATNRALFIDAASAKVTVWGGEYTASGGVNDQMVQVSDTAILRLGGGVRFNFSTASATGRIFDINAVGTIIVDGDVIADMSAMSGGVDSKVALFRAAGATLTGNGRLAVVRSPLTATDDAFDGFSAGQGIVSLANVVFDVAPTITSGANLQSSSVGRVLSYPFPFAGVTIDATTAKITLDGVDGTVAAGSIGIAENTGALGLSSRGGVNVFLDNNNVHTTQELGVYVNGATTGSATKVLRVVETGAIFPQNTGAAIYSGAGTPEGVVTANIGSVYLNTTGGAATSFYVKESGTGNTGWVAK